MVIRIINHISNKKKFNKYFYSIINGRILYSSEEYWINFRATKPPLTPPADEPTYPLGLVGLF